MSDPRPLGVFDSGIGGLTVVRELLRILPDESLVYYGDVARLPYGNKSKETVTRFSREITSFLVDHGVKAIVVACNTASALALPELEDRAGVPVVGVIEPGARAAATIAQQGKGKLGVIATASTVRSGAYGRAVRALAPGVVVDEQACPLFVPFVEEGWFDHPATELVAREYLAALQRAGIEALVLGCTHYPLLKVLLGRVMGPGVALIDSADETANAVARELASGGLEAPAGTAPHHRFVVSDDEPRFRRVGELFLGETLGEVEVVPLG